MQEVLKLVIDSNDFIKVRNIERTIKKFDIEYEVRSLEWGDYLLEVDNQKILFERKTIGDFIGSMQGNHLKTQLHGMQSITPYNFVLVVGNFRDLLFNPEYKRLGYSFQSLLGAQASLALSGARFLFCDNHSQMFALMKKFGEKFSDRNNGFVLQNDLVIKAQELTNFTKLLMCIKGISYDRAVLIETKYKSISDLKKAIEEDSFIIFGIGDKLKENIRAFINEVV